MNSNTPKTTYLRDYTPYPYTVNHIDLIFKIYEGHTLVTAKTRFEIKQKDAPLVLNGEDLEICTVKLNDIPFEDYETDESHLVIHTPPESDFTLEIQTKIYPEKNTYLEGLYKSGDTYCTQCEAEGFRRITYYPDRPDVLATYNTRIEAEKSLYPILLSNGNLDEKGDLEEGRHFAVWHDPFPKPCYLFALVAGNLAHIHDRYKTASGRTVDLYIYVRPGDEDQCPHAMESLKKSMKWDEDTYGLEYDLDIFNIVAVSDFNMGAMENKSLNIFNTALVLAAQETATDQDYMRVESVIGHEYFHNWSGNRVTCRDWFQLSLKEGLTVFRDQEFSADLHDRDVQRIDDVTHLRRFQFPEDAGPLAHPIRPDNYIEINNFYTMTVYEKGAEVIRMIRTIIGPKNYRKGTDLYFSRHDGEAATCEDFVQCMEDASGFDPSQFKLWYEQAGTPEITFDGEHNPDLGTYAITLSQNIPDTPGQTNKKPMHIPVTIGLLDQDGKNMAEETVHLKERTQTHTFENIQTPPTPSILRGFSAPVKVKTALTNEELAFLMANDTDEFNKWEAGQTLALKTIDMILIDAAAPINLYTEAYEEILKQALKSKDQKAFYARALSLPDLNVIIQHYSQADPPALYKARDTLLRALKRTHKTTLEKIYDANRTGANFSISASAMGQRALQNAALHVLTITGGTGCRRRAKEQYDSANNMTDRLAALGVLARISCEESEVTLLDFYTQFKEYPLVVDKWFAIQASSPRSDLYEILKKLKKHTDFNIKNPNRARSLYATFGINNPSCFHAPDGSGYEFLRDGIIELNTINPQIAARLLTPFRSWQGFTLDRQEKMQACLRQILEIPNISPNVFEIASKSLKV